MKPLAKKIHFAVSVATNEPRGAAKRQQGIHSIYIRKLGVMTETD